MCSSLGGNVTCGQWQKVNWGLSVTGIPTLLPQFLSTIMLLSSYSAADVISCSIHLVILFQYTGALYFQVKCYPGKCIILFSPLFRYSIWLLHRQWRLHVRKLGKWRERCRLLFFIILSCILIVSIVSKYRS